jgi:hypothetical protein
MTLAAGTRLGPYQIQSPLGSGGMGEVYQATDTHLSRQVAIKVLPAAFASDPERLARFEREAKTLAALNPPNIAQIYGFEKSDGIRALLMELVEGPTLADRIAQGPIPIDEALPIAKQIADALEAAHEQGIIHRDLKPANVKIRPDGPVKVLDFGLAKALEPASGASSNLTQSPTITSPAMVTGVGVLLGTAAYMSAEQARGKPTDKRGDIWAFGCVFYEMLTGQRAFGGEDVLDVLGAIAGVEPAWSALPQSLPATVRMLVETCLAKDRNKRTVDATTARFVLGHVHIREEPQSVSEMRPSLGRRWAVVAVAAGAAIGAIAASIGIPLIFRQPPAVITTEVTTPSSVPLVVSGNDRDIAITPDGERIVYRTPNALVIRALNQLEPEILRNVGVPRGIFVSPDNQWIGYFDVLASRLKKVSVTGGAPLTVANVGTAGPRGATWGSDGTIVYATASHTTSLQGVPAVGGEPAVLTRPDQARGELDHLWPEFLPGRRAVLFTIAIGASGAGRLESGDVAVAAVRRGRCYGRSMAVRGQWQSSSGTLELRPAALSCYPAL